MDTGKSKFWITLILSCLICYGYGYYKGKRSVEPVVITKEVIEVRDSIMIDSIFIVNKEIEKQIIYLEKTFDEKIPTILSNTDSTNLVIFTDYINRYNNQ